MLDRSECGCYFQKSRLCSLILSNRIPLLIKDVSKQRSDGTRTRFREFMERILHQLFHFPEWIPNAQRFHNSIVCPAVFVRQGCPAGRQVPAGKVYRAAPVPPFFPIISRSEGVAMLCDYWRKMTVFCDFELTLQVRTTRPKFGRAEKCSRKQILKNDWQKTVSGARVNQRILNRC
jgi:hypothetical protein